MEDEVRFRVLGSVGASVNGAPLTVGASRQRALLALLLLDANRRVHPHVLIEGIWGEAVPEHPDAALQIVVSRLRKALRPVADRLTSDPGGYRIDVADSEFDLLEARALLARAKELAALQDYPGCADATEAALALWNGDALADLREVPFYDTAHRELRDLQLSIYELRNRAYLRSGRHLEVLADIETWVRAEPWRERLRAHYMVALYRAGLRVDALSVYDDLRHCLHHDLGVEPSLFTQELHAQIVDQDPGLLAQHAGIVATLPVWTPRGLPFVGRSNEERRIFASLRDVAAGASRMVLVEGEAGIGKSRLVLEAAQRVHDSAIIIPIDGADALRPGLQKVASALADASAQLSDAELRLCLGRWPGDVADVVPALRRRLPDLPAALEADDEVRGARLRSAIVSWIGAMSQRAPVLLLVDDLHRSGPALLLLIGSLLVSDDPKRVFVLATARSGVADQSTRLVHLTRSLEQRGIFERVQLSGLSTEAVGYILAGIGVPDAARLAPDLARSTSGHPYLLSEMLREPDRSSPPSSTDDVAGRIRGFVLRRVATLGEASSQLLRIAAAIDGEFDVGLLSEIAHGTEPSTAALVDEVINGGFLHVTGLGSFDFVHDLTRRTIADATDEDERGRLHSEIARVLERRGAAAALVGAQWSRATGPDADHQTLVWAERAGKDALGAFDPYSAAAWFALAAERATDPSVRGYLLILLAGAQCHCGDPAGGPTLRAALEIAHDLDDGQMIVEAASLSGPIWMSMPALSHEERIELLGDGASRAPGDAVRARLLARLATELSPTPEWRRARALAEEARALATGAGDKALVAEVLMRHFQATWTPHTVAARAA
jgi:DNA-binding SARP family transcriptional activator